MDSEDFEFLLSQYFDGTLSEEERLAVEERLRTDPEAQKVLDDYRALNLAVGTPLPPIRWDLLAGKISGRIEEETVPPVYSIGFYRGVIRAGLAMAASALLAFGVTRLMLHQTQGPSVLSVIGPQAEIATGESTIDISVSAPREEATAMAYIYDENVLASQPVMALDTIDNSPLRQIH